MDKLQHEMYWNDSGKKDEDKPEQDKLQHEMYWNTDPKLHPVQPGADKLQHEMYWNISFPELLQFPALINYNMRCIETWRYWSRFMK